MRSGGRANPQVAGRFPSRSRTRARWLMIDTDKSLRRYQIAGFRSASSSPSRGVGGWSAFAVDQRRGHRAAVMMVESLFQEDPAQGRRHRQRDPGQATAIASKQARSWSFSTIPKRKSELGIIDALLIELLTKRARLEAQRDGADDDRLSADEFSTRQDEPDVARVMIGQQKLFETRRAGDRGQEAAAHQADRPVHRADRRPRSRSRRSKDKQIGFIDEELQGLQELAEEGARAEDAASWRWSASRRGSTASAASSSPARRAPKARSPRSSSR